VLVVSSFYHIPRVSLILPESKIPMNMYPAEAFYLLEDKNSKLELIEKFGKDSLPKGQRKKFRSFR